MKIQQLFVNFIPIFLLFGLLSYTEKFIHISSTVLGRLIAVLIIILYTSIDITHGILVTALIILYYQSDIVESMLSMYDAKALVELNPIESNNPPLTIYQPDIIHESVNAPTLLVTEDKLSYLSQYENVSYISKFLNPINITPEEKKQAYRKERCKKGHLVVKGQPVPIDMTTHVYPEITFINDSCNICDPTCNYTITESMIQTGIKEGFSSVSCRH